MSEEGVLAIITLFLSNLLVSWLGSILFTSDKISEGALAISDKKWKTFLSIFIGYSVIFFIIYLTQKN